MSANTKVLIFMAAVVAFVVGIALNSARVNSDSVSTPLLNAELIQNGQSVVVGDKLGKLTLVNFWASWCAPCRQEMPLFETMYRANSANGFQVVGIAIDSPENAQAMLDSMDITYPILYAQKTGNQLMETTGNPQGLLPYTLLLDEKGQIIDQVLGTIHEPQITDWLNAHLANSG